MSKKLGIIYSSYNNYDLLEYEVLKRVNFENYPIVNIDDKSNTEEQERGKKICAKNNIYFEINKQKGVQFAVDQGINFLTKKYSTDWIVCMQQDIYPLSKNFFSEFEKIIDQLKDDHQIGAIGFNILSDDDVYMNKNILSKYHKGIKVNGWLGTLPLSGPKKNFSHLNLKKKIKFLLYSLHSSNSALEKRDSLFLEAINLCEYSMKNFKTVSNLYNGLCSIDIPMWGAIAINTKMWKKYVIPRKGYIFHAWFVDIAFQLMNNNIFLAVYTKLYMQNIQKIKTKYGFHWSSAHAGRDPNFNQYQVETYGDHKKYFKKFWGFEYEKIFQEFESVKQNYNKTLIHELWNHDYRNGPLKKFL